MKIAVIGMGYIGLPTSILLSRAGYKIIGVDINEGALNKLSEGSIHIREMSLQKAWLEVHKSIELTNQIKPADVYIICVPTPFTHERKADLSYVNIAVDNISAVLKKGDLVILESTSPPGTVRAITERLINLTGFDQNIFHVVYCPERVIPGNMLYELVNNDRIIGSQKRESALIAKEIYKTFVNGNIFITDDVTAEMCKLVENSFRDVNLAFANELSMICNDLGIDVEEVISLANRHPRVNILNPGVGVGGHCIPVDPWFIVEKFEKAKLIETARKVNDFKPLWTAAKIEEKINFDRNKTIAILGLTYKPNVDDIRESPSLIIASHLMNKGYKVIACEPNIEAIEYKGISLVSLDYCLESSDIMLLAQMHNEFKQLPFASKKIIRL